MYINKIKQIIKNLLRHIGLELRRSNNVLSYADPNNLEKANLIVERYREIISDPLNILIERVPQAGYVDKDGNVFLHNGNRVPIRGEYAYYENFSDILIINRGVHEPLEEYCFQTVLKKLTKTRPVMIELGSYWSHYSMWLINKHPGSICYMVEPDNINIESGKNNFKLNGYDGIFINSFVGNNHFIVDDFVSSKKLNIIDILHADIQGYEVEMLHGAKKSLLDGQIKYVFISTHSEDLHEDAISILRSVNYRIEISSGFDNHTTSFDGFIFASSSDIEPVFINFSPLGRSEILKATPHQILKSVISAKNNIEQI